MARDAALLLGGLLAFLLSPTPALAQQRCDGAKPATAPAERFTLHEDGTVSDAKTGLQWMRCALGQSWDGGVCAGEFQTFDHGEALAAIDILNGKGGFAGRRDWRLPSLEELSGIVEQRCFNPALDVQVFPATPITGFWSATPVPGYPRGAMLVHLYTGGAYLGNRSVHWAVRPVRGARR